jgi:hypothetical protein
MNSLILGILYLVAISFAITLFFSYFLKKRGPWKSFWASFIIILLSVFAADVWIGAVGPFFYDSIYWVPPLIVGLLIALLLAATTPSPQVRSKIDNRRKEIEKHREVMLSTGIFFWFLFIFMLVIVIVGLLFSK